MDASNDVAAAVAVDRPAGPPITSHWLFKHMIVATICVLYAVMLAILAVMLIWPMQSDGTSGKSPDESPHEWERRTLAAKSRNTVSEPCRLLLDEFADAFADFMGCMVRRSRPLRFCTGCASHRYSVERTHANILRGTGPSDAHCHYELLGQDDVELVTYHIKFYERMVELNRCDLCMARQSYGGYKVNDDVLEYLEAHEALIRCLENSTASVADADAEELGAGVPAGCAACRGHVARQGRLLETVTGQPLHPIPSRLTCADVVDSANATHRLWRGRGCTVADELRTEDDEHSLFYPRLWAYLPVFVAVFIIGFFVSYAMLPNRNVVRVATAAASADEPEVPAGQRRRSPTGPQPRRRRR